MSFWDWGDSSEWDSKVCVLVGRTCGERRALNGGVSKKGEVVMGAGGRYRGDVW